MPSVREVTRRTVLDEGLGMVEQVTPAKEEQGSGDDKKSQEEKKRLAAEELGMSVRQSLIARNAEISSPLSLAVTVKVKVERKSSRKRTE